MSAGDSLRSNSCVELGTEQQLFHPLSRPAQRHPLHLEDIEPARIEINFKLELQIKGVIRKYLYLYKARSIGHSYQSSWSKKDA